jgi:hypothetical protein
MAKTTAKEKTPSRKRPAASKTAVIDPFETLAEAVVDVPPTKPKRAKAAKASSVVKAVAGKPKRPKTVKTPAVAKPKTKKTAVKKSEKKISIDVTAELAAAEPQVELSPVFKALAEPKLPELQHENRARLMMQSPTELYFYWSIARDPYHLLRDAFEGETGSYTLVLKLNDLRRGIEEIHRVDAEGNWWFAVEAGGEYRAEIGFYAPNRPYFRIVYSNTIETPRRSPSPHPASESEWKVTAHKFAEVLDVAGFSEDAFDVAMAGDDHVAAEDAAHAAFSRFIGVTNGKLHSLAPEDIRYTMVALASGQRLDDLRWRVSPSLFAVLQANADKLDAGNAMSALTEHFDIDESEFVEEHYGSSVHGASLINFPRTLKTRKTATSYRPLSSHSIGR